MKKFLLFFAALLVLAGPVLATETIDINTASLQQLDQLKGIGPVLAQRLIDARPFLSLDDLLRVSGIGEKTLQEIKNQGLACVSCRLSQKNSNQQAQETTTLAVAYSGGVFINELLPNPEGPDETNEWIELYNSNNFTVDLSAWTLRDAVGNTISFIIPQATNIAPLGYLVFKRTDTKIMLNNDEDRVELLTPDKKTVDSVNYTKSVLGKSYNKNTGWFWSDILTPGAENAVKPALVENLPKSKKSDISNKVEAGFAALSQNPELQNPNNQPRTINPWFLFFTVLVITIILAATVLYIKIKLYNHVRT